MLENNVWFVTSAGRGIDLSVDRDEPSHIHIARPSRPRRPDEADADAETTAGEIREIDRPGAQSSAQAA